MTTPPQHPAPPQHAPQAQAAPAAAQPQGYWPGQAPLGGYVSPIPVRRATLADAILSEWTKIRSVRSTMWTLGTMIVLTLGIGFLAAGLASSTDSAINGTPLPIFGLYGVMLGIICVITLGVLAISVEYGTGLIRTTLTACPARARVLTAKAIVFFLLTFAITLVCTALVAAVDSALLSDQVTLKPTGAEWLRATVGVSLYVALTGLVSLAVGQLVRHSAGAITIMLGVLLLPYVMAMFMFSEGLSDLRSVLIEYSIPTQLIGLYIPDSGLDAIGDGPTGWIPLAIIGGAAVVALGGAYASLLKRDA